MINLSQSAFRTLNQVLYQKLRREIDVWRRLDHDNIVPLLGVTTDVKPYTSMGMVSPWMENGDLTKFLRTTPPITVRRRLELVSPTPTIQ